ncbi:MAG TPA: protein kinase [Gemmatimonadaceae bacterium]|nr:protein kinase [Gemmatimonadaceae bacterium]
MTSSDLRDHLQASLGDTYRLERELGGGGMSRVFVATEEALGREVVIKVLSPELAQTLNVDRFRREIQLAARLQHPHIVPLLAAGEADGVPFFTMPFIQGDSLRARVARGGELPVTEAVRILREVASALAYAHARGVVHRDIKPDNVLVSGGSAMVTDFGVAKALTAAAATPLGAELTQFGVALGTPAYMAPEQAAADPATDHRADLYAFGAMAYELLTGTPPFTGRPTQALLAAHAVETPESISRRRPAIGNTLGDLIMRCLEKRPADRPQSADEIVRTLDTVATSGGTSAVTATHPATTGPVWRQLPRPARIAALAGVLIFAGTGAWLATHGHRGPASETMLAVLPFENDGPANDEYFADGLTDAITNRLASLHGLGVIDRRSARQYKSTSKSARDIGRELGVQYVLEGTVRWAKDSTGAQKVEITPTLVNTSNLSTKPAGGPYIVIPSDVFQVDSDVATKVADALDVTLNTHERMALRARPTRNAEAYDAYLRGEAVDKDNTMSLNANDVRLALEQYQRATNLDPHFALALAKLGDEEMRSAILNQFDTAHVRLAGTLIDSALKLDPNLPEGHDERSFFLRFFRQNEAAGYEEKHVAVALRPNDAALVGELGNLQIEHGQLDSGFANLATSVRLDPRSAEGLSRAASTSINYRRYADAATYVEQYITLSPSNADAYDLKITLALKSRGDTALARQTLAIARKKVDRMTRALAEDAVLLGPADRAWLAALKPADLGLTQQFDSVNYYLNKALLFVHADPPRAHANVDSLLAIVTARPLTGVLAVEQHNVLGLSYAMLGRAADAEREMAVVRAAIPGLPNPTGLEAGYLTESMANDYGLLGNADSAVAVLRRALVLPNGVSRPYLLIDPAYTPIRTAPSFQALVAEH